MKRTGTATIRCRSSIGRSIIPAVVLAAAGACIAQPKLPLAPSDFVLAGIPAASDSIEIRLSFGEPDSVTTGTNPFGSEPLVVWHYDGFEVRFAGDALPSGYMITAPGEATGRGLRVGDSAERVLELYGEPDLRLGASWTFTYDDPERGLHVVDVGFDDDVVTRIYIGRASA